MEPNYSNETTLKRRGLRQCKNKTLKEIGLLFTLPRPLKQKRGMEYKNQTQGYLNSDKATLF